MPFRGAVLGGGALAAEYRQWFAALQIHLMQLPALEYCRTNTLDAVSSILVLQDKRA